MLKGVKEWALLEEAEKFEAKILTKRKEYNDLLERVIQVLDELNDLERLLYFDLRTKDNGSEAKQHF